MLHCPIHMKALAAGLSLALLILPNAAFAQTNAISSTEQKVRAFFADNPVMVAIAQCESKFTQFNAKGVALHGGMEHHMIGIFQINAAIHRKVAKALGFDINTIAGNLAYAQYLFRQEGTVPWLDSSACWQPLVNAAGSTAAGFVDQSMFIARLQFQIGEISQKIAQLKTAGILSARTF